MEKDDQKTKRQKLSVLPKGASLFENVIDETLEKYLINQLNQCTWSNELSRRVIHFGHQYLYHSGSSKLENILPIPSWIPKDIIEKLCEVPNGYFDQVIVNEYKPGQGIGSHIDHSKIFDNVICTLSLGSDCVMVLTKNNEPSIPVVLKRNSLLKLSGESRYQWKHSIPKRKIDLLENGEKINRSLRISITFRHMK